VYKHLSKGFYSFLTRDEFDEAGFITRSFLHSSCVTLYHFCVWYDMIYLLTAIGFVTRWQ